MNSYIINFLLTGNNGWLAVEERPFPLKAEDRGASSPNGLGVGTLWPCLPRGGVIPGGASFSFCISTAVRTVGSFFLSGYQNCP